MGSVCSDVSGKQAKGASRITCTLHKLYDLRHDAVGASVYICSSMKTNSCLLGYAINHCLCLDSEVEPI